MSNINRKLVQELYYKYPTWQSRTEEYNKITGENRKETTLSKNYSRHRKKADVIEEHTVIQSYAGEMLTPDQLLMKRGLDPALVQLKKGKSTYSDIGTTRNDEGKLLNSYLSIEFEPRTFTLSRELLEDMWKSMRIEPYSIEKLSMNGKGLLVISLNDVHIWNNTFEDYKNYVAEIVMLIETRQWDQIIVKQGGDWFHVNNSQGTTVAGTQVGYEVSKRQMFKWGSQMMHPILVSAVEHSNKTKYVYIEGNHDKDLAWGFAWGLKALYPQIEFDIEEAVYKKHVYKNVLLLMAHGDKPRNLNTLGKVMFELFRKEMAVAETVEIHTEHEHHEKVKDDMGMLFRTNPTANKTDKYHLENGYIGARKIFQCFVYNDYEIKMIYNVTGRV